MKKLLYIVFIIGLMAILIYPIIARNQDKKEKYVKQNSR